MEVSITHFSEENQAFKTHIESIFGRFSHASAIENPSKIATAIAGMRFVGRINRLLGGVEKDANMFLEVHRHVSHIPKEYPKLLELATQLLDLNKERQAINCEILDIIESNLLLKIFFARNIRFLKAYQDELMESYQDLNDAFFVFPNDEHLQTLLSNLDHTIGNSLHGRV